MRTPTTAELKRLDHLVKNTGQNIIDAIGVIKEMKQTSTVVTTHTRQFAEAMHKDTEQAWDEKITPIVEPGKGTIHIARSQHSHDDIFQREYMQEPIEPEELPPALQRNPGESKYAYKQRLKRHQAYQQPEDDFDVDLHDDSEYETQARTSEEYRPRRRERNIPLVELGSEKPSRERFHRNSNGGYGKHHGVKKRRTGSKR